MQAVQAGQITFEDYFMASLNVAPLKIVGWEGVLGAGFMIVVLQPLVSLLPGRDGGGIHEDPIDSLHVRRRTSGHSAVHTACLLRELLTCCLRSFSASQQRYSFAQLALLVGPSCRILEKRKSSSY